MNKKFIKSITDYINNYYSCYYEEAPNTASFPYLIIPEITFTPLNQGFNAVFDIEVYINELCDESVEEIMDILRDNLDGYSYYGNDISYHVGFDTQNIVKSTEQDLSIRRITFSARIFK